MSLIQQLKELRAKVSIYDLKDESGTYFGNPVIVADSMSSMKALIDSLPKIIAQLEAGERLAQEVRFEIVKTGSTTKVAEALAQYEQSTKEICNPNQSSK